jgi:hypothetical protein
MPSTIYRKFIVVASLTVFLLGTVQCYNSFQRRKNAAFTDSYIEACEFIRNKTPLNSSFALVNLGVSDSQTLAFMRLTERENFAVFKFVPTEKVVVQQWYQRQIDLRHLSEEIQYAEVLKDKYGVDYVLTTMRYDTDLLELVYDTDKFLIYRIR